MTVQTRRRSLEEVVLECVGGVDPVAERERMESELIGRGEGRRTG